MEQQAQDSEQDNATAAEMDAAKAKPASAAAIVTAVFDVVANASGSPFHDFNSGRRAFSLRACIGRVQRIISFVCRSRPTTPV